MCGKQFAIFGQLLFLALCHILGWFSTLADIYQPPVSVVPVKVLERHVPDALVSPMDAEREANDPRVCSIPDDGDDDHPGRSIGAVWETNQSTTRRQEIRKECQICKDQVVIQ